MKKLIAKTVEGKEFSHSKKDAFFVSANALKIVDALNKHKYQLAENEKWYLYDYDFTQDFYVNRKIFITKDRQIKIKTFA
mgnify:CR=1 FL=1